MKILIRRSKPLKTEYGVVYLDEPTRLSFCKTFKKKLIKNECASDKTVSENKCFLTKIPLKKYIHPNFKNKLKCYKGDFYKERIDNAVQDVSCKDCDSC